MTAAMDVSQFKRTVLPFVAQHQVLINHPRNEESAVAIFPVSFIEAEFIAPESSLTAETIWVEPALVYSHLSFSEPEVQETLAGLGVLTEYGMSFMNGPM